jgi:hypothetical protein
MGEFLRQKVGSNTSVDVIELEPDELINVNQKPNQVCFLFWIVSVLITVQVIKDE